jgi:hypothetical protein
MDKPRAELLGCLGLIAAVVCVPKIGLRAQFPPSAEQLAAIHPIEASAAPRSGTYLLAVGRYPNASPPPLPCIPPALRKLDVPVYPLGSNLFWIDDSGVDYAAIDEAQRLEQALSPVESEDGPGGQSVDYPAGSLWLDVAMTNDLSYGDMAVITINGTTNDTWYEVLSKRSLSETNWWSEGSLPGFTNQPTSQVRVTADRSADNVFLSARVLTNGPGGTLPLWWQLENFGRTGLDPESSPGAEGLTLLQSYLAGTEPNLIEFAVTATDNYSPASPAWVRLQLAGGIPFHQAVLLDSTNFGAAVWGSYTSTNLEVDLGSTEGWHDLWLGLRGYSGASHPTWKWKRLKLDTTSPRLSLLSPAEGVVTQSTLQLVGSCPEALRAIWYDLSNSVGVLPNQPVPILDQHQDTNTWELTSTTFQAFDVPLAEGTNLITLHATDLAGNQTVTNFTYTLDYSNVTNPPSVQVTWPPDGIQVAASNVTLRGWTDDPTATVRAQTTGANGIPRTFCGLVERTGHFWVDNIPLAVGTNLVTLTLTNAAAKGTSTSIRLVRGDLLVAMNPVTPPSELWRPALTVTGTISDPSYAVWVNGVKAMNPGNGGWIATNVPVTAGNVAIFRMTAYSPEEEQPDGSHGN